MRGRRRWHTAVRVPGRRCRRGRGYVLAFSRLGLSLLLLYMSLGKKLALHSLGRKHVSKEDLLDILRLDLRHARDGGYVLVSMPMSPPRLQGIEEVGSHLMAWDPSWVALKLDKDLCTNYVSTRGVLGSFERRARDLLGIYSPKKRPHGCPGNSRNVDWGQTVRHVGFRRLS